VIYMVREDAYRLPRPKINPRLTFCLGLV
jgi:hypothetical protein